MRFLFLSFTILLFSNANFAQQSISCPTQNIHATLLSVQGNEAKVKVTVPYGGAAIGITAFHTQDINVVSAPTAGGAGTRGVISEKIWTLNITGNSPSIKFKNHIACSEEPLMLKPISVSCGTGNNKVTLTLLSVQGTEAKVKISAFLGGAYMTTTNFNIQNATATNAPGLGGAGDAGVSTEKTWTLQKAGSNSSSSINLNTCPTSVLSF
ncbi:MAG: hypothetical protein KTR30_07430 [Saprospiraceae bacterium]|nr:hypothetical protein [Saprospiraceae bacterium]